MPPKKSRRKDKNDRASLDPSVTAEVRRLREVRGAEFSTAELHMRFERHVANAQDAYLKGDNALAEKEASAALSIKPTPSIFALLSVIAESKGQFDRASDFRLLQAFLARDVVLWEELLHDFLSQQLYYKSVVCLQRMSVMEQDPARYRQLQFQLADLLIGLGEIRRATHVLVPLWNSSKCRDFEVFALLSSLYFQLGKWSSLQRLITSSLKNSFRIRLPQPEENGDEDSARVATTPPLKTESSDLSTAAAVPPAEDSKKAPKRVSKRVRFFGVDDDEDDTENAGQENSTREAKENTSSSFTLTPTAEDDFSFDELEVAQQQQQQQESAVDGSFGGSDAGKKGDRGSVATNNSAAAAGTVRGLYGDSISLTTATEKRNFLTLINVHAELLNEGGKFAETVQLMEFTATALRVEVLDLPPDLLVRLGTAYAFLGRPDTEQPCRDVFNHLLETCRMDEYGDVLLDAALSLQKVGMHVEAHHIFDTFTRYYQFSYKTIMGKLAEAKAAVEAAQPPSPAAPVSGEERADSVSLAATERLRLANQNLSELQTEHDELKTVMAAAYYGAASSLFSLHRVEEAESEARKALEADPTHLQVRLLLGRIYFHIHHNLRAAVDVLTPKEGEPALHRIQLGARLVRIFFRSSLYVEAIALGVSIFEIIIAGSEDGDTESVAPGSSRRSTAPLLMPTMSRASSAIVPASTLGPMGGGGPGSVGRLSASLAASIRAGTSVYQQQFSRRGRAALTTTVYGASAAASVAAGWGRDEEEAKLKDSSTIFRFHRKRRLSTKSSGHSKEAEASGKGDDSGEEGTTPSLAPSPAGIVEGENAAEATESAPDPADEALRRRRERVEAVTTMAAKGFWDSPADGDDAGVSSSDPHGEVSPGEVSPDKEGTERKEEMAGPPSHAHDMRKDDAEDTAPLANRTDEGERDRNLADLEAFADDAQQAQETGEGDDGPLPESYELPSLEEVSKRFNDPAMAQLFLQASSNEPRAESDPLRQVVAGGGSDFAGDGMETKPLATDRVSIREAIAALGRMEFMNLTVAVVDSYSALGKFTEAKEFAFLALSRIGGRQFFRRMGTALERPLRLALLRAAMAAGHSEDAFRVGLRLLQDDQSVEERNEVMELMHGVLNRCEDRTMILYRVFTDGACDVPLLVLLANRYYQTRSYTRVLNLYLCALQERPTDIFLNFMVGLCYLFVSHQKYVKPREALVSAGIYYLSQYQSLLMAADPSRTGEALYNSARALHFLKLYYLCVPLYQRVAQDLPVPERCSLAVRRAASVNLYYIHAWVSENRPLALSFLPHVAEGETSATHMC